ncbi:MAG: hypothetical protein JNL88_05050, partial [Bacteroidia bacterium]|nr:hypothetical protein [Bacteroidia bacterium]
MKKILCLFLPLLMGSAAQAQYGQRLYDLDSLSQEWFNDGLITDQFLVSGKPVYAATGKVQSPTATGALIERSRFARIGFTGATQANRFYYLFYNGAERPSRMNSICEGSNAFLMSGVVYSNNAPGTGDVLLLKTAASGVPQSVRKVDLGGFDESFCTRRSAKTTSKYYTCGSSYVQSSSAAFLMKHNASGSVVNWVRKFSLPCGTTASLAEATSVIDDSLSGNVVVIGHVRSASPSLACQNAFIARFSASGALHWLHFIASNNAANFNLQSIRATNAAQEYVITGSALNPANGKNGILLMRVNTAGAAPAFVFSKLISSPGPTPNFPVSQQAGYDVVSRKDSAGVLSYYVAGQTSYTFGSGDGTMLRADQNG